MTGHRLRWAAGGRASTSSGGAAARSGSRPARSILAGGAINTPQLLQLSGVGRADDLAALGIPVVADLPGVGGQPPGPPRGLHPVHEPPAGVDAAGGDGEVAPAVHRRGVAVPAQRAGRDQPLRGRRLRAQQRRGRLPEPDVPLPAAGDPLRRQRRRGRPRLPGPRRPDVLRRPRVRRRSRRPTRTTTRRCASTTSRPSRTGASGSRPSGSPGTSSTSRRWTRSTAARRRPGRP